MSSTVTFHFFLFLKPVLSGYATIYIKPAKCSVKFVVLCYKLS